jgi:three-Cys-motif partner protein
MPARRDAGHGSGHEFGGDWTTAKLDVLAKYLNAYTKALKDKPSRERPFVKAYIDAFAGTGYRDAVRAAPDGEGQSLLFPDLAETEPQRLLHGSARRALETSPSFDRYIFIEKQADRCAALETLKDEFPGLARKISVRRGEANTEIRDLCGRNWSDRRAVLFLDPYGLQVEWTTIEAIAATKAMDLWLLFPLGIGVNRLVTRSGEIPQSWRDRLDALLGTTDWHEAFYQVDRTPTLFGDEHGHVVKATMETIGRSFTERLKSRFPGVADPPGVLRNSRNHPLYLLCFAAANEKGTIPALRIANHLLRGLD